MKPGQCLGLSLAVANRKRLTRMARFHLNHCSTRFGRRVPWQDDVDRQVKRNSCWQAMRLAQASIAAAAECDTCFGIQLRRRLAGVGGKTVQKSASRNEAQYCMF